MRRDVEQEALQRSFQAVRQDITDLREAVQLLTQHISGSQVNPVFQQSAHRDVPSQTSVHTSFRELFEGKTILITGGTGFLGRELTKEILKYNPKSIRIFSRDEVKHHKFQQMFHNDTRLRNFIGNVRDYPRLLKATREADIVIHAAALKRLDLIEYNVEESIQTNILGTLNVVRACLANDVEKAVLVSTDKACSPVNTYGACKLVAERIFSESNYSKGYQRTVFTTVRYGNVLESTGSVVPFFKQKIQNGEAVPLTDPRMTRFIISPGQAVELVFNAIKYGVGGEVFIPRLPAFAITDLIAILDRHFGTKSRVDVVGIRPGEKFHELMINGPEIPRTYAFENLYVIASTIDEYLAKRSPLYVNQGRKLDLGEMEEYSSKDAVVPQDEAYAILKKFDML